MDNFPNEQFRLTNMKQHGRNEEKKKKNSLYFNMTWLVIKEITSDCMLVRIAETS